MNYISSRSIKESSFSRRIRRFLVDNLFSRGPKFDKIGQNIEKIHRNLDYLSNISQIGSDGIFRLCYLDEYLHKIHHNTLKFSLFDPLNHKTSKIGSI